MKPLSRTLALLLALSLLAALPAAPVGSAKPKEIKIRGYVTELHSADSFEIEDYRVASDQTLVLEFENVSPGLSFKREDLRVGTLVEIRGLYDEEWNELRAKRMKIDLAQFRALKVTTVLDRKPLELRQLEGDRWGGTVAADGRRIRVEPDTRVLFKLNKAEKKEAEKKRKEEEAKAKKEKSGKRDEKSAGAAATDSAAAAPPEAAAGKSESDDDGDSFDEDRTGFGPLKSLADIGPGVTMTYEGREQSDGTVLASFVEFVRNEKEKGEESLWKQLKVNEKPFNFDVGQPGELKVGGEKYKVLPNQEVQDYVARLGDSLIPEYQRSLPADDPQKIPFRFTVIVEKGFNAAAYPNGVVIINSGVFDVLENEAQLAAVVGHEIAHATQEHTYRRMQKHKKKRTALMIGALFAAGMGYGGIVDILQLTLAAMVNGHGRTMENQADRVGMEYMVAAGYDPRESPRVWKLVAKKHGDYGTNFFWSSHDSASERRSFQMVQIRNVFSGLDHSSLKKNEEQFQKIAVLVKDAAAKKRKIKVVS
jgi:Zn-dependent protease with chaperone function